MRGGGRRKSILKSALAAEANEGAGTAGKRGWPGAEFFAGASNQISLMKWVYGVQPDEPEATASMPMLPKIALRGNFLLGIGHFISEIADCTQQQKTQVLPSPSPAVPACSAALRHGAY